MSVAILCACERGRGRGHKETQSAAGAAASPRANKDLAELRRNCTIVAVVALQ